MGDLVLGWPPPLHQRRLHAPHGQLVDGVGVRTADDGAGIAPTLTGIPPGPSAVVMADRDAPGGTFIHWTRWNAGVEGRNSFGHVGYSGPCPPRGDKPHRYVITVYSLRHKLGLAPGATTMLF